MSFPQPLVEWWALSECAGSAPNRCERRQIDRGCDWRGGSGGGRVGDPPDSCSDAPGGEGRGQGYSGARAWNLCHGLPSIPNLKQSHSTHFFLHPRTSDSWGLTGLQWQTNTHRHDFSINLNNIKVGSRSIDTVFLNTPQFQSDILSHRLVDLVLKVEIVIRNWLFVFCNDGV